MRGFDFKEYKIEQTASILYPYPTKRFFGVHSAQKALEGAI